MIPYRNAFYGFLALLAILVIGFWPSYFSRITEPMHASIHLHSLVMLAWVLLLITQSWLIRNRKFGHHKKIGKASFVIAPLVVFTGIWVNFHFQGRVSDPLATPVQAIFWFGFFLPLLFGWLYFQAIRHRRDVKLHSRYMVLTALVFLIPGLGRASGWVLGSFELWTPSFLQLMFLTLGIALWLMIRDWRRQEPWKPQLWFSVFWAANIALFMTLPNWGPWNSFSQWAGTLTV